MLKIARVSVPACAPACMGMHACKAGSESRDGRAMHLCKERGVCLMHPPHFHDVEHVVQPASQ